MRKAPFFVTHSNDEGARRDGIATIVDTINNSINVEVMTNGTLRPRKSYKTFAGMVYQLWLINQRYTKMGVKGDFTVRLPLKPGGYK